MGMLDTIHFQAAEAPRCAHDHPITSLQSKNLKCIMTDYYVLDGQLYRHQPRLDDQDAAPETWEAVSEILKLTTVTIARPLRLTAAVRAYSDCDECEPVLVMQGRRTSILGDMVDEHRPWCEFKITFKEGRLESIKPKRVERREKVAADLRKGGARVLEDDDPLAVLHRRRRDEEGRPDVDEDEPDPEEGFDEDE